MQVQVRDVRVTQGRIPIEAAYREWLEDQRILGQVRSTTLDGYRYCLLSAEAMGVEYLEDFTHEAWRDHVADRLERGNSRRTINWALAKLKQFVRWCVDRGYSSADHPILRERRLREQVRSCDPLMLSHAQWLVRESGPRHRLLFAAYLSTGARLRELLELRRDEVRETGVSLGAARVKTNREETMLLGMRMTRLLSRLAEARGDAWVWPQREGCCYKTAVRNLRARFRAVMKRGGVDIPRGRGIHLLRHTCATLLLSEVKATPAAISRILRHKHAGPSAQALMRVFGAAAMTALYTHADDDQARDCLSQLETLVLGELTDEELIGALL